MFVLEQNKKIRFLSITNAIARLKTGKWKRPLNVGPPPPGLKLVTYKSLRINLQRSFRLSHQLHLDICDS
jgi:hypothetical protein